MSDAGTAATTVAFISHSDCGRHDTGWEHPEHVGRLRAVTRALRWAPELFQAQVARGPELSAGRAIARGALDRMAANPLDAPEQA